MDNTHYNIICSQFNSNGTLVFLHEGLGCIKSWRIFPKQLCEATKMQGLVYDRPGYGGSPGDLTGRTNAYLLEAAHHLKALLDHLDISNPILYGHSDGGSIALAYAALYPKNISCLVSEAAHVLNEKDTIDGIKKAVLAFEAGKLKALQKWHGQNYELVFNAWAKTWLRPTFDLKSLRTLLPQIEVSQLIIQGKQDQYGTRKQVQTISEETRGETTIFSPNCGHAPFQEKPDEILTVSAQFINTHLYGNT